MTIRTLEAMVESINHGDLVSEEEERAVLELFQQFSRVVQQISRPISHIEICNLITSFQTDQPYLRHAEIINVSSMKDNSVQPYKNFEVRFQNAIVRLGRRLDKWVFYYTTTS